MHANVYSNNIYHCTSVVNMVCCTNYKLSHKEINAHYTKHMSNSGHAVTIMARLITL